MKAITYQKNRDQFELAELPIPAITSDFDVLVAVDAVGLNPVDTKISGWHTALPNMDETFVTGLDVSGRIVEICRVVTGWQVGDRVLYHGNMFTEHGGFAEYAIHDFRTLIRHPNISAEIAASTPCAAWIIWWTLVDKLNIKGHDSLFIAGGAGGVGSFATQIARHYGVKTIITTASARKHDYVRQLGATHAIDYHNQNVIEEVVSITGGKGVERAFDCVGGSNDQRKIMKTLAIKGLEAN